MVRLSRRERTELEAIVRHQCGEARLYRRARIVWLAAEGESKSMIARQLGTNRERVGDWVRRFERDRLAGLNDHERSGRPIRWNDIKLSRLPVVAQQTLVSSSRFGLTKH